MAGNQFNFPSSWCPVRELNYWPWPVTVHIFTSFLIPFISLPHSAYPTPNLRISSQLFLFVLRNLKHFPIIFLLNFCLHVIRIAQHFHISKPLWRNKGHEPLITRIKKLHSNRPFHTWLIFSVRNCQNPYASSVTSSCTNRLADLPLEFLYLHTSLQCTVRLMISAKQRALFFHVSFILWTVR